MHTTDTKRVKLAKHELVLMLADQRMAAYPALYDATNPKHLADAKAFVVNHLGPTKAQLVLSARCLNLIPTNVEVF